MDNERQVKFGSADIEGALVAAKAKDWFLQVARDFAKSQERYNLDVEFSKTKKARSPLVLLTILATVVLFGGSAFWFTTMYSAARNKVVVSSSEFENVDLRDLLDQYRKLDSERLYQVDLLRSLENQAEELLQRARLKTADRITFEKGRNLEAEEEARRIGNLEAGLERELAKIGTEQGAEQSRVKLGIADLEGQIAALDQDKLARALSLEVVLSADRKLFDQEMNRTRAVYEEQLNNIKLVRVQELKERELFVKSLERQAREVLAAEKARLTSLYNPVFNAPSEQALLSRPLDSGRLDQYKPLFPSVLLESGLVAASDFASLEAELQEIKALYRLTSRVPYVNDMPPLLRQLLARSLLAVDEALVPAGALAREVLQVREELGQSQAELDAEKTRSQGLEQDLVLVRSRADSLSGSLDSISSVFALASGKVGQQAMVVWIDPSDQSQLRGYLNPALASQPGMRFYATRKDTIPLGEFEVQVVDGAFAVLKRQDLPADLQSRLGRLDQKLRLILPGDWLVPKESYKLPGAK